MRRSDFLRKPILCDGAVEEAAAAVQLAGERGVLVDAARANLSDVLRRWEAEAPARRVRAELVERGLRRAHDDYQAWLWQREGGWWTRLDPERALQVVGLPDDDVGDEDPASARGTPAGPDPGTLPPPSPASTRYRVAARRLRSALRAQGSAGPADRFAQARELEEARAEFNNVFPASHGRLALVERSLELEGVVLELLASAHPHLVEHPAMTTACRRAREALSRELASPPPEVTTLALVVPETGTWMDELGRVVATGVHPRDADEESRGESDRLLPHVQAWLHQAGVVDADVCAVDPREPPAVVAQFLVRGGRVVGYA